jgi:cephalosporin hydroxylase
VSTSLWTDFQLNPGRLIHKWSHYFPIYEQHFARFRNRPLLFMEIGCGQGGSLPMWKRFFGPHVQVLGIDIRPECKALEADQIAIRIGSQSDPAFLDSLLAEFGPPEIVLDDGSHIMSDIRASFAHLYPRLNKDGVYMVEDLHTAYWPDFEGGLHDPRSFIELCKGLIDELNGDWTPDGCKSTAFTRETMSMHFYDSVAVFEKGRHPKPRTLASASGAVILA